MNSYFSNKFNFFVTNVTVSKNVFVFNTKKIFEAFDLFLILKKIKHDSFSYLTNRKIRLLFFFIKTKKIRSLNKNKNTKNGGLNELMESVKMVKRKSLSICSLQDDYYDGVAEFFKEEDGWDQENAELSYIEVMEDCNDDYILEMKRGEIHRIR